MPVLPRAGVQGLVTPKQAEKRKRKRSMTHGLCTWQRAKRPRLTIVKATAAQPPPPKAIGMKLA